MDGSGHQDGRSIRAGPECSRFGRQHLKEQQQRCSRDAARCLPGLDANAPLPVPHNSMPGPNWHDGRHAAAPSSMHSNGRHQMLPSPPPLPGFDDGPRHAPWHQPQLPYDPYKPLHPMDAPAHAVQPAWQQGGGAWAQQPLSREQHQHVRMLLSSRYIPQDQPLLRAALGTLAAAKPQLLADLAWPDHSVAVLQQLAGMRQEAALLVLHHLLITDVAPRGLMPFWDCCCKWLGRHFSVAPQHSVQRDAQLWRSIAQGEVQAAQGQVPLYVMAWDGPAAVKQHAEVRL